MAPKHTRRSELTQLVPDHVFGHEQLDELPAVVHHERVPDEIRHDRAVARPRLERLAAARAPLPLDFGQQPLIHVRPFFHRSTHLSALHVVSLFYKSTDYRPPCLSSGRSAVRADGGG